MAKTSLPSFPSVNFLGLLRHRIFFTEGNKGNKRLALSIGASRSRLIERVTAEEACHAEAYPEAGENPPGALTRNLPITHPFGLPVYPTASSHVMFSLDTNCTRLRRGYGVASG
jgi:hypothetical protein